jgi:site-specific recombinase XerD
MALPFLVHPDQDEDQLKFRGVSLVAFLHTAKKRTDGTATINLRIVHNRFPKYYTTKIVLGEDDYLKLCGNRPKIELQEKKRIVFAYLLRAYNTILKLDQFSFEAFDELYNKKTISSDIFSYFEAYKEQLIAAERIGTSVSYEYASKKLSEFIDSNKLSFDKINVEFLVKFEKWITSSGNSPTTVGYYVRCIKKLYNDAIRLGDAKIENYPFGDIKKGLYSPPRPRNIKKALTLVDLKNLIGYKPIDGSPEQYYRDIWVFSYLGNGINMKDVCQLKYRDIKGENIHFERAKTTNTNRSARPISIALIQENLDIIKRWGNPITEDKNYIFPVLSGDETPEKERAKIQQFTKQVNKYIKRIAKNVGIKENISTYSARHSFATVLKRSGINLSYISEALGHSNLKTTESYLDSFEDDTRKANTLKLLDFSSTVKKPPRSKPSTKTTTTKKKTTRKK